MTTVARSRADWERWIGATPIEELHAARGEIMERLAELRARHGSRGTFERRYANFRDAIGKAVAGELEAKRGKKPSEDEIKREANTDPRLTEWLDTAEREMAEMHVLEDRAEAITEIINRDQALARFAATER